MVVNSATDARAQIIEEQFWAVVANIPGAVYRCSCQDDWPIRFISDYIELLCGYPASDFVDNAVRTYGSIIHPHDRPYVAEEIDRALEVGAPYSLRYRVLHADGGLRWVSERGRAILGEAGERLWLDGVLLDVTEQVLAEQDRDRAEAAVRQQARLGGDEFGILLHDGSPSAVAGAAERIHAAFAAPFSLDGLPLQIEASIGARELTFDSSAPAPRGQ